MKDLGSVAHWIEKIGIRLPKGSPYTRRFGKNYKNKMVYTAGKIPGQGARGPYTKMAADLRELSDEDLKSYTDMLKDRTRGLANDWLRAATGSEEARLIGEGLDKHKDELLGLLGESSRRAKNTIIAGMGMGTGLPGLVGAAAGAYEATPGNRMSGATRGGGSAALGGALGTIVGHRLGAIAGHPRAGAAIGSTLGGGAGYYLGRPKKMTEPKLASIKMSWFPKPLSIGLMTLPSLMTGAARGFSSAEKGKGLKGALHGAAASLPGAALAAIPGLFGSKALEEAYPGGALSRNQLAWYGVDMLPFLSSTAGGLASYGLLGPDGKPKIGSLMKEAPAKSKAQAKFMAIWEKKHGHPEKAKEWFEGTSNKPEHVKKKKAELNGFVWKLGSALPMKKTENPLVKDLKRRVKDYASNVAYHSAEAKADRAAGIKDQALGGVVPKRSPSNLTQGGQSSFSKGAQEVITETYTGADQPRNPTKGQIPGSFGKKKEKKAVGTGDADYESPHEGSYGKHRHVIGESECHLCKGHPLVIQERNDKSQDGGSEKAAEVHDRIEYGEILKLVAEMHQVDLTSPESVELLPQLMREVDHIISKHESLETAEEELQEQMIDRHEHPQAG